MTDSITLTGMVIKSSDVGDYDKRLVILTKERGKIVAFARGARRAKSMLVSGTRLFAFGEFTLYEGREAYTLSKMEIENYFTEISTDMDAMCYGCYFLEFVDYFSRENVESTELLKLLYQTLRALMNEKIPNRLIRCIFELKVLVLNGMYPELFECIGCRKTELSYFSAVRGGMVCEECRTKTGDAVLIGTSTIYAMQFIITSKIEKLYTFLVKEEVLGELEFVMRRYLNYHIEKEFNSLKILNTLLK
ncbi:MAG: DNA repair protein RecO [Lachnospiraceae bacterium]|nr:DNA repair protein RecO [Lachnospiraceae bacterium]